MPGLIDNRLLASRTSLVLTFLLLSPKLFKIERIFLHHGVRPSRLSKTASRERAAWKMAAILQNISVCNNFSAWSRFLHFPSRYFHVPNRGGHSRLGCPD